MQKILVAFGYSARICFTISFLLRYQLKKPYENLWVRNLTNKPTLVEGAALGWMDVTFQSCFFRVSTKNFHFDVFVIAITEGQEIYKYDIRNVCEIYDHQSNVSTLKSDVTYDMFPFMMFVFQDMELRQNA